MISYVICGVSEYILNKIDLFFTTLWYMIRHFNSNATGKFSCCFLGYLEDFWGLLCLIEHVLKSSLYSITSSKRVIQLNWYGRKSRHFATPLPRRQYTSHLIYVTSELCIFGLKSESGLAIKCVFNQSNPYVILHSVQYFWNSLAFGDHIATQILCSTIVKADHKKNYFNYAIHLLYRHM